MPGNYQEYKQLAQETMRRITGSYGDWTDYLNTASRLYKYPFNEQVMIYMQRPDATACAEYDVWNKRMGRYVKRGSKGIALIDTSSEYPRLKYVFDVSDTGGNERSREVKLWQLRDEQSQAISEMLEAVYHKPFEHGLQTQLLQIAEGLADEYWQENRIDIIDNIAGSLLEGYDDSELGNEFRAAVSASAAYTLMSRCGLEPGEFFEPEDFRAVRGFDSVAAATSLGTSVSSISEQVLRQIEVTLRDYERAYSRPEQAAERTEHHERNDVHSEQGLPDTEREADGNGENTSGQVRSDAQGVSQGASTPHLEQDDTGRNAVSTSLGDRRDSPSTLGADDAGADASERRDGGAESPRPDEVGGHDEQPESAGRGNDSERADLQLTDGERQSPIPQEEEVQLSFFLPESEQIAYIEQNIQAESVQTPFAFSVPQEDMEHILRLEGNADNARMMVAAEFSKGKTDAENGAFLQKSFHGGNGIVIDDRRYSVWYGEDGIHIAKGDSARHIASAKTVSWQEAAVNIRTLLEQGKYATNVELAEAPGHERLELAWSLWYLRHDISNEARDASFFSAMDTLNGGGFLDETERLAEALADPIKRNAIVNEYRDFLTAYNDNRSLLRFRYHKPDDIMAGLAELSLPRTEYVTEMTEIPSFRRFITEDEITACLSGGSSMEGGKGRIYSYFLEKHSSKEQESFLRNEYGIGGHAPAVSGDRFSSEEHNGKGIILKKRDCPDVQLNWANVAKRISELIRKDRFLTPDEKAQYEQLLRRNTERNADWNDYNAVKETHPDNIVLYQVGDFFEFYGEDAKTASDLLQIRLNHCSIPNVGRVDMCGIPAHRLEQYTDTLRSRYDVTISAVNSDTRERISYTLRSFDHEAEQAVDVHEAEHGADGTRAFGGAEQEQILQEPTVPNTQAQLDKYIPIVRESIEQDNAYRNACGHSDRENAVLEGRAAIRRAVLDSGDIELIKAFSDNSEFRESLYETVIEQTYSRLHEQLRPLIQDDIDNALRQWNGDMLSKQAVVRYMKEHSRERSTAAWLANEYGAQSAENPVHFTRAGSDIDIALTWTQVQRRIVQLIEDDTFYTASEKVQLDAIHKDSHTLEERQTPRYLVTVYHHFENGFDEKFDYDTLQEAENAAQGYVAGTMESDGFKYDGAAVYDLQEKSYVRIYGDYPDERAQAQVAAVTENHEALEQTPISSVAGFGESDANNRTQQSELVYTIGDRFTYPNADNSEMLLTAVEQNSVSYILTDRPEQPPVDMSRDEFDRDIVNGFFSPSVSQNRQAQLLEQAVIAINGFCIDEYGENADFSDLKKIAVAYTTVTDASIPIQVNVNLVDFAVETTLNAEHYETRQYSSLQSLIDNELAVLDFNDLVPVDEEEALLFTDDEPKNALAQEAADYEAERMAYREQVMSTLTPEQQRIVEAMETGGFPFRPNEREPIYFGDDGDYPTIFESWDEAYDFINEAELKLTPGLREKVQAVLHPEPPFPYAVGDTVYLEDGKPFIIENIGNFNIQLRDSTLLYPIFRAESKESFARLMERFPQRQKESVEQNSSNAETKEIYPSEQTNLPYDIVIEPLHIEELKPPTLEDTADGAPVSVQINGEWQTFSDRETAETAMYRDYKDKVRRSAENYRITDDDLGVGSAKAKFRANMDAISLLKQLESEGMQAAPEQQEVLSRYVGWGGLADAFDESKDNWKDEYTELHNALTPEEYAAARASTLNAHYTTPTVIRAIYDAVENMGFQTGNILEPSMGVGNFFGMLPDSMKSSKLYGVELDSLTGRIAKQLYPKADITVAGFETTDKKDFYDLAIGNVPFGNYKVSDRAYDKLGFSIHNYFFAKAIDQVCPGGVVAFVTSRYTLDSKDSSARKHIAQRADFLGAIRLPNNAFKANAGTEVVTDIIFLQKRDRPIDIEPDWVHLGENADGFTLNSYFVDHPEMVLGRLSSVSTQYGKQDLTVEPFGNSDLAEQLAQAIQNINGTYTEAELPDLGENEKLMESIPADPNVKNYSYTVVDGEVYYRQNSIMTKPDLNATAKERVKGMVELRDCVQRLIGQQMDGFISDETIRQTQAELNTLYDNFTAKHGLINSRGNALAFADDNSYYLLCSLEELDEDKNLKRKADMFTKRTIKAHEVVTSVDTASEALALSISEKACVDMAYMSELTGKDEDTLASELRGVIYKDFSRKQDDSYTWRTADDFLSGNVREKLAYYTSALERFAGTDKYDAVRDNIEALKAAQPKDLDASEIEVRLGATWIGPEYIRRFMWETFDTPIYQRRKIDVSYSAYTAEWNIKNKGSIAYNDVAAYMTYGTERANAYRILEDSLNLRDVRIYDTVYDADGKERRVLNSKETTLAQQKQQAIKDAFRDWIWKDPVRRHELVTRYNELFNSTRPREYDGSHITFYGMNPEISLREHQKNAVAHVLYGGNTLLAHQVGAGKTFEMVAAAMESKRLGLCQKSLFVVPNHLTEQWSSEFLRLYPSANILVATKKDFEPKNRKKFCARIATGEYDAVIIGHSQFEKIPVSMERQERLLQEQISEIEEGLREMRDNRAENFSIKALERTKRGLEAKLKKLQDSSRKDDVVTFEQLGVDRLYVDEAHGFKNLFLYTKMRNVAGLSTTDAQKSSDMLLKCRYIDEMTDSRGIVFATGTPVSNSMTELYTMMRYLQHDTIRGKGLAHFDCWASTFGETQTAIELAPEGTGYRARTRFAKFFNLPELMNLFKEAADIKTADQLNLPTPTPIYHNEVAHPTEIQQNMVQELSERAARVHAQLVEPSEDNMLKITSDGRKLGLDQRIINPDLPDDPASKVNMCVDNIARIYEEGSVDKLTQLVFCDLSTPRNAAMAKAAKHEGGDIDSPELNALERLIDSETPEDTAFSVYDDIREKLVARGIPREEIAFIHEANTEVRRKELYGKVRSGQVRVMLGSTFKCGSGMNVQDRLIALHDLDCPWRPGDLEQRSGRIIRQGNMNKEVHIYRYVTEGTFDSYLWQTVENKQRFISQIMTSKSPVRACEDVDETALSYAEIKALCAGDNRIKEKMDLDVDVARLKLMKANHQSQQFRLEDNLLKHFPEQIKQNECHVAGFEQDMKTLAEHPHPKDGFAGMEVKGDMLTDKDNAGAAILEAIKDAKGMEPVQIGSYRGFSMSLTVEDFGKDFVLTLKGAMAHRVSLGKDARGNLVRIDNALNGMPERMQAVQERLTNLYGQMEAAKAELGKPFPQEEELRTKSARLTELNIELNIEHSKPDELTDDRGEVAKASRHSIRDRLKQEPQRHCGDNEKKQTHCYDR